MDPAWNDHLTSEMNKPYFQKLREFVKSEQAQKRIYPDNNLIFNAFEQCSWYNLNVVILGGEPYTDGGDHGLAWSKVKGDRPEGLNNIFSEIFKSEFSENFRQRFDPSVYPSCFKHNNLSQWAHQGVLLLNMLLTAEKGKQAGHKNKGWEEFCISTLKLISDQKQNIVFMIWGKMAQEMAQHIDRDRHLVLEAAHPGSYTAGGFYGCGHFEKAKEYLLTTGPFHTPGVRKQRTINWFVL